MEHQLSALTEAWALYFGLIFIAFVLFAPQGIWGLATGKLSTGQLQLGQLWRTRRSGARS